MNIPNKSSRDKEFECFESQFIEVGVITAYLCAPKWIQEISQLKEAYELALKAESLVREALVEGYSWS